MSSVREKWVGPFSELGISRSQLMSMSENEFNQKCSFCIECGFAPDDDFNKAIEESLQDIKKPTIVKPVIQHNQNAQLSRPTSSRQSSSRLHSSRSEKTSKPATSDRPVSRTSHKSKISDLPPESKISTKEAEMKVKAPSQPKQAGKDSPKHISRESIQTEKHHHHGSEEKRESSKLKEEKSKQKEEKRESSKPKEEKRESSKPKAEKPKQKEEKRESSKPKEEKPKQKEEKRESSKPKEEKPKQKEEKRESSKPKEEKRESSKPKAEKPKPKEEKPETLNPENGINIAFSFPDGKRICQKFAPSIKGAALKKFIASQETMFTPDKKPIGFTLQQTLGPELKLDSSLQSQGITKNTMFLVVFDD